MRIVYGPAKIGYWLASSCRFQSLGCSVSFLCPVFLSEAKYVDRCKRRSHNKEKGPSHEFRFIAMS